MAVEHSDEGHILPCWCQSHQDNPKQSKTYPHPACQHIVGDIAATANDKTLIHRKVNSKHNVHLLVMVVVVGKVVSYDS